MDFWTRIWSIPLLVTWDIFHEKIEALLRIWTLVFENVEIRNQFLKLKNLFPNSIQYWLGKFLSQFLRNTNFKKFRDNYFIETLFSRFSLLYFVRIMTAELSISSIKKYSDSASLEISQLAEFLDLRFEKKIQRKQKFRARFECY